MKWKKAKSKSKRCKKHPEATSRETSVSISIEPADWAKGIAEDVDKNLKDLGVENVSVRQSRADKKPVVPASELAIVPGTGCMSQKKKKKKGHKKTADELIEGHCLKKTLEQDDKVEYQGYGNVLTIIKDNKDGGEVGYSYTFRDKDSRIALWITDKMGKGIRRKAKEMGWS